MRILVTSPSLNLDQNVSGVAAVTAFIIKFNTLHRYRHFEIGKKDNEKRNLLWLLKLVLLYLRWLLTVLNPRTELIHYNFPIDKRSVIRDVPLILFARLLRKKMVIHVHGGEYMHNKHVPIWAKKLLKHVFSGRNPVIFLSEEEKEFISQFYGVKNSFVLPNSVDPGDASEFHRNDEDFKTLKFLFLGRICKEKGLGFIYDAFLLLIKEGFRISFVMAGKGPEEDYYKERFGKLLGNDFVFKGVVKGVEKNKLLKQSNIFLLPSFFEGLPIALLEGMAYGQIPLVTSVGAIPKVVSNKQNGLIVEPRSARAIAESIRFLTSNEADLTRMSNNARNTIFDKFHPKLYIENLNKIYQNE